VGASGARRPGNLMRVHIVGAGLIGNKRAAALGSHDFIVSITDPDAERRAHFTETHRDKIDEQADPTPQPGDAAIIATTHDQLVPAALPFAHSGCHLLVEKPGARNPQEFTELITATQPSATLAIGYNHRFHPAIRELKKISEDCPYGPVLTVRARYGHGGREGYEKEWRASKEQAGGGELLDQGSHLIDLTRFVAGDFTLSHAELATLFWNMEVEDNAWLLGRLPNSGRASLHASWTEWKNLFSFEVAFTTAKVEVNGLGGSYGPESLTIFHMESGLGPPTRHYREFPPGDESWVLEWQDFTRKTTGESGSGATADDALAILTVIQEAYRDAHH